MRSSKCCYRLTKVYTETSYMWPSCNFPFPVALAPELPKEPDSQLSSKLIRSMKMGFIFKRSEEGKKKKCYHACIWTLFCTSQQKNSFGRATPGYTLSVKVWDSMQNHWANNSAWKTEQILVIRLLHGPVKSTKQRQCISQVFLVDIVDIMQSTNILGFMLLLKLLSLALFPATAQDMLETQVFLTLVIHLHQKIKINKNQTPTYPLLLDTSPRDWQSRWTNALSVLVKEEGNSISRKVSKKAN